jgi:hypothetical protein
VAFFHLLVIDFGRATTTLLPPPPRGDASETTLKENDDDDDNTTIMEFTTNEDSDAQTLNQDTVKKEADNKESEKNEKNDPSQQLLRNDIIHSSSSSSSNIIEMTNDMMMMPPPPKPQELPAPAVVEPTKCIEPTNEEMKESKGERTTAVVEERESAPEKCTDDLGSAVQQQQQLPAPPPRLCRPIQKARTAYFIFADEKRAEIAARVSTNSLACHFLHGTSWSLSLTHVSFCYYYCSTREKEWVPSHERLVKCGLL